LRGIARVQGVRDIDKRSEPGIVGISLKLFRPGASGIDPDTTTFIGRRGISLGWYLFRNGFVQGHLGGMEKGLGWQVQRGLKRRGREVSKFEFARRRGRRRGRGKVVEERRRRRAEIVSHFCSLCFLLLHLILHLTTTFNKYLKKREIYN